MRRAQRDFHAVAVAPFQFESGKAVPDRIGHVEHDLLEVLHAL
jgi:hypothetical protein